MSKRIGFVQPNFRSGPAHLNAYYLPYTVGVLWAYALSDPTVKDNFTNTVWIFRRSDPVADAKCLAENCDIVFFSTYVWNWNYCTAVCKHLKRINPEVITVFGGPQVPHSSPDLFLQHPYIDTVIVGEGENATVELLHMIHHNKPLPQKHSADRMRDLDLPSPYLLGIFDELMAQHPDIEWMPTLETDRGCPYKCTFCDWGSLTASKVVKVYMQRIRDELDWFGKRSLPFLTMTNANFGIFRDRDNQIADLIVESKRKYGYPTGISVSYAKNSNADVFNIIKKFSSVDIQNGFTLSLQSADQQVLGNIERTNMDINDIQEITRHANSAQLPIFTEMILGLPGETTGSFKRGMFYLFESGLHNGIDVFLLNMIENAPMQRDVDRYDIKTFTVYDMFYETEEAMQHDVAEGIDIILSTNTMSSDQIRDLYLYSLMLVGLHSYGLSDVLAKYCNNAGIGYEQFYDGLIDHLSTGYLADLVAEYRNAYHSWTQTGFFKMTVSDRTILSWQAVHSLPVVVQQLGIVSELIDHIAQYAQQLQLPDPVIADYKLLTAHRIKQFTDYKHQPTPVELSSNLWEIAKGNQKHLTYGSYSYIVKDRFNQFSDTLDQHLDNILYGRRRNWGLNIVDTP